MDAAADPLRRSEDVVAAHRHRAHRRLRPVDDHPVRITVDDDLRRSRLTVFFRLLLAIPHLVWLVLWTVAVVVAASPTGSRSLVTARLPRRLPRLPLRVHPLRDPLGAYLWLAANPFPGFIGEPGYPVDVEIAGPQPQSRWKTALRLVLAIPALLLAAVLGWASAAAAAVRRADSEASASGSSGVGGVAAVCAFLGWFASLAAAGCRAGSATSPRRRSATARRPTAYMLLAHRPLSELRPERARPDLERCRPHPVRLVQDDDGRRSRLTVFFRLLLAIPHFVWLALWRRRRLRRVRDWSPRSCAAAPPSRCTGSSTAYVRYTAHVCAFRSWSPTRSRVRRRARLSGRVAIGRGRSAAPAG